MEVDFLIEKLIDSNLKQVHRDTGIPYDRMFKWTKGKGNPKKEDYDILVEYFKNGKSSSFKKSDKVENDTDQERIIDILKNHLKEKDERLVENDKLYLKLIAEKNERIKDKDVIIATKDEALMLWKEKANKYEKKISSRSSNFGNEGDAKSSERLAPPFED